jgi:hypothetical protein
VRIRVGRFARFYSRETVDRKLPSVGRFEQDGCVLDLVRLATWPWRRKRAVVSSRPKPSDQRQEDQEADRFVSGWRRLTRTRWR